jgi:hypothetical protein
VFLPVARHGDVFSPHTRSGVGTPDRVCARQHIRPAVPTRPRAEPCFARLAHAVAPAVVAVRGDASVRLRPASGWRRAQAPGDGPRLARPGTARAGRASRGRPWVARPVVLRLARPGTARAGRASPGSAVGGHRRVRSARHGFVFLPVARRGDVFSPHTRSGVGTPDRVCVRQHVRPAGSCHRPLIVAVARRCFGPSQPLSGWRRGTSGRRRLASFGRGRCGPVVLPGGDEGDG